MDSINNNDLSNFIKIQTVLSRANRVLRHLFSERWTKYSGNEWDPSSVGSFISGIGKKVYGKYQKMPIQRKSIESGNLNEWDLTTLTDVLMLTDFPNDLRSKQAKSLERSKLEELKKVRNKLAHAPSLGVEDELFETLWRNGSEVLVFFGCLKEDLDKIKSSSNLSVFQDENSSGHVNKANSEEATRLKNEANDLLKNDEFKKAIEVYSKAISLGGLLDSELATLHSHRSVAYLSSAGKKNRQEKSEEMYCALQDGKEAVKFNPTWFRGYFRTGNAYFELSEFRKALEYFDSALSLSPGEEDLLQSRDNCRMKLGQEIRREHMDPAMMPKSEADQMIQMQTRNGVPMDLKEATKLINSVIPGYADVGKAHELRNSWTTNDLEIAAKLYAKAASVGNAEGMYNLGLLHKDGKGVKQDLNVYIKLMRQAAAQPHMHRGTQFKNVGVAEAEHSLGLSYDEGIGVKQDVAVAAEWYKKASDHGCSGGSNNLGFLYMNGRGVPLNIERGIQYWKLAANQGNQLAMHTLAWHYLEKERDPREAREWFERADKHGNLDAQLNRAEFEDKLEKLEKENKEVEDQLVKWEKESGLSVKGMTLKSRIQRKMREVEPGIMDVVNKLEAIYLDGMQKGSSPNSFMYQFDPTVLEKYAQNGSKTASQILTSMSHFVNVCELLMESDLEKNTEQIIQKLSECFRICELVVQLRPHFKDQLCDIVKSVLKSGTASQLDRNARICFCFLQMDSLEHTLIFAERSKQKYPDEKVFHVHYGSICGFLQKYEHGAREMEKSLEIFPNDVELLYFKAVHLRLIETKQRAGVIKAYEEFLAVAPPDHRKVPESYYAISNEYFVKRMKSTLMGGKPTSLGQNEMINRMEEYYQLGLNAEKIQLPCFLPYDSTQKAMIENHQYMISVIKSKHGHSTKVETPLMPEFKPRGNGQESGPNYIKLSDPNRILVIKYHREHLEELRRLQPHRDSNMIMLSSSTTTPANLQRAPVQLAGLKPITFLEMDTLVDKVYEGRVIQVTSVDNAGFGVYPSIRLVLQDETGNLLRAFIYNFPETDEKIVQQKLGFGTTMSILNPHMGLAKDGKFGLRIEDPSSLFLHTSATIDSCRFCAKENSQLRCGKCKWANYCSKKCQEMDWKLMKHKVICVPL